MKTKALFSLILFSILSCKTAKQIENEQFIISDISNEIVYKKIDFDNSYNNYFFQLQEDINKYSKNDKKLVSDFALYRLSNKDLKLLIPSGDLKKEISSFNLNVENQIKHKKFFNSSDSEYYPYSNPKTITSPKKINIKCEQIEASSLTYDYNSAFYKKTFEILREDYFFKENNRFWHLTIYITDKENREKIKQKYLSIIEKIRFKKEQPDISNYQDLN